VSVAFARAVPPPEDPTDADQLVEWFDERGVVTAEWLRIKELIAAATKLDSDTGKGGDDDL